MCGIQCCILVRKPGQPLQFLCKTKQLRNRYLLLLALLCASFSVHAQPKDVWRSLSDQQQKALKQKEKKTRQLKSRISQIREWGLEDTYKHELSLGVNLHTNGLGGHLRYVTHKKGSTQDVWLLRAQSIHHEKEIKQQRKGNTFRELGAFKPYSFGKINTALSIQLGYGKEQLLLPPVINENIAVYGSLTAGASIILQKPVYLNLIYTDGNGVNFVQSERYEAQNAEHFLNNAQILGADKWVKGLGAAKIIPGLFLEPSLIFVPAKNKSFIQRIYVGGNIAYHLQSVEIMALRKALPFQASFFVGIGFGKRWK